MKQRRSFGQVFLKDKRYIQKILDNLELEGEIVLEIGPGRGAITDYLSGRAKHLYCVEVDRRFCNFLQAKFSKKKNVEIIHADILKFPLSKLGKNIIVFGNIPYHISSELIKYLIDYRKCICRAYLTFQKEFVQKITAKPSSNGYNFLSCYLQYYAAIERLFDIKASAFEPVPKVNSTFSKITFYPKLPLVAENEDFLFKVIRKAFSGRRKKIVNSLPVPEDKLKFFSALKIDPNLRAENISLEEYVSIANSLYRHRTF